MEARLLYIILESHHAILPTSLLLVHEVIDNHDSGYLGMAVQLYVQAHLGYMYYHILTQKDYSKKNLWHS